MQKKIENLELITKKNQTTHLPKWNKKQMLGVPNWRNVTLPNKAYVGSS